MRHDVVGSPQSIRTKTYKTCKTLRTLLRQCRFPWPWLDLASVLCLFLPLCLFLHAVLATVLGLGVWRGMGRVLGVGGGTVMGRRVGMGSGWARGGGRGMGGFAQ